MYRSNQTQSDKTKNNDFVVKKQLKNFCGNFYLQRILMFAGPELAYWARCHLGLPPSLVLWMLRWTGR